MSEWIDCPKCGTNHENLCACPMPVGRPPPEEITAYIPTAIDRTPASVLAMYKGACAAVDEEKILALQKDMELWSEIKSEMRHGREKYGTGPEDYAHDDSNSDTVWHQCINDHNLRALIATPMERRQHLVKVAGLAISAIQSHDRKAKQTLNEP